MDHLIPQTSVYTFAKSQFNKNFDFIGGSRVELTFEPSWYSYLVPLIHFYFVVIEQVSFTGDSSVPDRAMVEPDTV